MKKASFIIGVCLLVAAGSWARAATVGKLVGGRGTAVAPELVEPAFPYPDDKRSPFLPPGAVEATNTVKAVKAVVASGELSAEEVMAGIIVQAVFLVRGEPQALVNNQAAKGGQSIKVLLRGKVAEVVILQIDRSKNAVHLNYKGKDFVQAMGGNKIGKP